MQLTGDCLQCLGVELYGPAGEDRFREAGAAGVASMALPPTPRGVGVVEEVVEGGGGGLVPVVEGAPTGGADDGLPGRLHHQEGVAVQVPGVG